jgi:hypothetical protein
MNIVAAKINAGRTITRSFLDRLREPASITPAAVSTPQVAELKTLWSPLWRLGLPTPEYLAASWFARIVDLQARRILSRRWVEQLGV